MARNPPWTRDELILALDLYLRHNPLHISKGHPAVVELSEKLNSLGIHPPGKAGRDFRNPNGVYMKLCNYLRFDPSYEGKGLQAGNKLEEEIWAEFSNDTLRLSLVATAIVSGMGATGRIDSLFMPLVATCRFDIFDGCHPSQSLIVVLASAGLIPRGNQSQPLPCST